MSKVICDICGTSYPETAPKCPICGYAKKSSDSTSAGADVYSGESSRNSAKGGHFSKKNVRKRTGSTASEKSRRSHHDESNNTGLVLVVIFLLVAIVAVVIYIGLRIFKAPDAIQTPTTPTTLVTKPTETKPVKPTEPTEETEPADPTDPTEETEPADPTEETEPADPTETTDPTEATEDNSVPCESMQLSNQTIEFVNAGDTWTIQVRPTPSNTTQRVIFTSSDSNVVTVDETGLLVAVGGGEATITVTCGEITKTCEIKCSFETPTVVPTQPPVEENTDPTATGETTDSTEPTKPTETTTPATTVPAGPIDPNFTFEFNTKFQDATSGKWDTSMLQLGETWRAYKKNLSVDPSVITWTTDDPAVCTVENGIVTAVGPGKTEVHAQYGDKTFTCIIRCKFEVDETVDVEVPTVEPTEPATGATTDATVEAPTDPTTEATTEATSTEPTTEPETDATTDSTSTRPTFPTIEIPIGTTATTAPTTAAPVDPNYSFAFNTKFQDATSGKWDTTLQKLGETWRAYKNDLPVDPGAITWTSDDPAVCTVKDGVVTAVGNGKTEIHAEYNGVTYTCIIRVNA